MLKAIPKRANKLVKYNYDQVLEASAAYFKEKLPASVWLDKYAMRDSENNLLELTPDDMHDRLASEFARIDSEKYGLDFETQFKLYRDAMHQFARVVPQGSPMCAIGNTQQIMSASNCVVVESPEDSIAGIMKTGTELAQLMKRRCVEDKSFISTLEKGIIHIKDAQIGMHILSFDTAQKKSVFKKILNKFTTEVPTEDRVIITFSNGAKIRTSKKHPILVFENGIYLYRAAQDMKLGDSCVKPEKNAEEFETKAEKASIAWFIGAHIGDGTCGITKKLWPNVGKNGASPTRLRFRIIGDNEAVTANYGAVLNSLTGSTSKHKRSTSKRFSVPVFEYVNAVSATKKVAEEFLDNQIGKKTYSAKTPTFVVKHNLWLPYIAGLIDTDGHLKDNAGSICIRLCAKSIIEDIAMQLSKAGISYYAYETKERIRKNGRIEQKMWGINIHGDSIFWELIGPYLRHSLKKEALQTKKVRSFSHLKYLADGEISQITEEYVATRSNGGRLFKGEVPFDVEEKKRRNNLSGCIGLLKKNQKAGMGALLSFKEENLISDQKLNEICQRVYVESIDLDSDAGGYTDLEVESTNNFFAGNFGFINIHNCGVGVDLSTLRPEGAKVNNAARSTSGAYSFSDFYSYITRMIAQKGRRGALMLTLDAHHPDVIKFATMKSDSQKVTGANVSIRLSDAFLQAVDADAEYEQYWPMEGPKQYSKMVKAQDVWKVIIDMATKHAEPGLIFWDKMTQYLPAHSYKQFRSRSTNPCSEISLSAYDSCRLISLNLTGYVRNAFTKPSFDWDLFKSDVKLATQMCDNLVDLELELIEKIKTACDGTDEKTLWQKLWQAGHDGRRTGLGTHGVADALAQMNIKYDSEEALEMVDQIYSTLCHTTYETSTELAKVRGPFPVWDWNVDKDNKFIQSLPDWLQAKIQKDGRRNIAMLTQAPTGSVSIISKCGEFARWNVSSGVEPVFRNFYIRRKKINPNDKARIDYKDAMGDTWQEYPVFHPNVKNYLEKVKGYSLTTNDDDLDEATIKKLKEEKLPDFFTTSDQIDWRYRIQLQGREQQYICHSISSTINLPKGTTSDTVGAIYLAGWKNGLKGLTVYVDGCRDGVLLTESDKSNKIDPTIRPDKIVVMSAPKRPKTLPCDIHQVTVDGKKWTAMIGLLHNVPYEVFLGYSEQLQLPAKHKTGNITKTGKGKYQLHVGEGDDELLIKDVISVFDNPQSAWATRLLSMSLRHGTPIEFVVDALSKDGRINDINRVIARVLKKYIPEGVKVTLSTSCTNCKGTNLRYQEGCVSCIDCGNSKCN